MVWMLAAAAQRRVAITTTPTIYKTGGCPAVTRFKVHLFVVSGLCVLLSAGGAISVVAECLSVVGPVAGACLGKCLTSL
jgi:hypothetical protein